MSYIGRFAPSPTGPLHFGSLVAALGSWLDARHQGGTWLVRMEDLDRPREVPGAADRILSTLEAFGLEWDGSVEYQSRRDPAYGNAAEVLRHLGLLYPCGCSRAEIRRSGRPGPEGPVYPGTCRNGLPPGCKHRAQRLLTTSETVGAEDRIQGTIEQNLESEIGDFVLRRADLAACSGQTDQLANLDRLRQRSLELLAQQPALEVSQLAIDGEDVMNELGCEAGPLVGDVLRALLEQVLDQPEINQRDQLLAMVGDLAASGRVARPGRR